MLDPIETIERASQEAWSRGDYAAVARHVLDGYGEEIHAFLLASTRGDVAQADDAFSQFIEDFWRGLPKFEWRSSLRGWCYRIARNALSRHRRAPDNRPQRRVALSAAPLLEQLAEVVRSRTRPYLRSEVKDEFQKLRENLSEEEQTL